MKPLKTIYSIVNTRIGDEDSKKVPPASYVDAAQLVLDEIAREVYAWQYELRFLVAGVEPDSSPSQQSINIPQTSYKPNEVITVPDYTRRVFANKTDAAHTVSYIPIIDKPHSIVIPARYRPYFTQRITRSGNECYEKPWETIKAQIAGNYPYKLNDEILSGYYFATKIYDDETMEILFSTPFTLEEEIVVQFMSGSPGIIATVDDTLNIPDWIAQAVIEGVSLSISKLLAARGNREAKEMIPLYQSEFLKYKYNAISYSRMIRDKRTTIIMQPLKWLPEQ